MRLIHPRQSPAPCCIVNLLSSPGQVRNVLLWFTDAAQWVRPVLWPAASPRVARCLWLAAPEETSNCGIQTWTRCTVRRTPTTWESPAAALHLSLKWVSVLRQITSACSHFHSCSVRLGSVQACSHKTRRWSDVKTHTLTSLLWK